MTVPPALARRAWGSLETLHVTGFFAPEVQAGYDRFDVPATRAGYFAARASAFGPCGPELVAATFYVFSPRLVAAAVPEVWTAGSPAEWATARRDGVAARLHEVLGPVDVTEAVELARTATEGLTGAGRPLYAAWSAVEWPEDPLLQLWHAGLLLREHRGDGHVTALLSAGLDPVEALVTGGLSAGNTDFVRSTRGWSEAEWAAGEQRCRLRGLVDDGGLTEAGRHLRDDVETVTDLLALEGWQHLGAQRTERLIELVTPLRQQLLDSGTLPDWIRSRG